MTKQTEVLQFYIGNDKYCLAIETIEEVILPSNELRNFDQDTDEKRLITVDEEDEEDAHLTNIPYSNDHLIGLMDFRGETLEVINTVGMFNLKTKDQIESDRKRKRINKNIRNTFEEIKSHVNESVENNNMDSNVANKLGELIETLQNQVVDRPEKSSEIRNVNDKNVIILNRSIGEGENYLGLLIDSVSDVRKIVPEDLNSSVDRKGIIGTIKEEEKIVVWIDPVEAFKKESIEN